MKYVVLSGSVNKKDTKRYPDDEFVIGVFDNYLEAYGTALLHLNDVIRSVYDSSDGVYITPLMDWGEGGYRMDIMVDDDVNDYVLIYKHEEYEKKDERWK